jgi:Mg2+ and Co2+ transporter CorA
VSDILRDKLIAVTSDLAEAKEVIRSLTRKHESQEAKSREYEKDCQDKSKRCFDALEKCHLMPK